MGFLVLDNRDRTLAQVFSSQGIWSISNALNFASFPIASLRYFWSKGSFVWASPFIWEITNGESVCNLMHYAAISQTTVIPSMTTSYSIWSLVVGNSNLIDTSITKPKKSRITLMSLSLMLDYPLVKITHARSGSWDIRVISTKKSGNTWDFRDFLTSKDTSNSNNSVAHFVKRTTRTGR